MKKNTFIASLLLGGYMFAQTTPPVETPVAVPIPPVEILPVVVAPPVIESKPGMFSIGADFRTRAELDNGQRVLLPIGFEPETTVFSRARLNFDYKKDKLTLKFAPQAIRVWGETPSFAGATNKASNGSQFEVYEAWAQYAINPTWGLKIGRMPLSYDDERLFGALDWQMAGRNFDVAKLIFTKNKAKLELVGGYYNDNTGIFSNVNPTDKSTSGNEVYTVLDGGEATKSLQILHYENEIGKLKFSLIAVNNTVQIQAITDATHNSLHTFGINPSYKINDKIRLFGSAYYQGGRNTVDKAKKAYQLSGNLEIKPIAKLTSTLGAEILSGTAYDEVVENNAFSPFYGTNHKFNGYMDYFYVNNHFNSRGLNDFYLKSVYKATAKGTLAVNLHAFMLNKELSKTIDDKFLGTELDLVYTHKVSDVFTYNIGYSQMMGSMDTMKALKNVANPMDNQSWAWVALAFSPKLFTATLN